MSRWITREKLRARNSAPWWAVDNSLPFPDRCVEGNRYESEPLPPKSHSPVKEAVKKIITQKA